MTDDFLDVQDMIIDRIAFSASGIPLIGGVVDGALFKHVLIRSDSVVVGHLDTVLAAKLAVGEVGVSRDGFDAPPLLAVGPGLSWGFKSGRQPAGTRRVESRVFGSYDHVPRDRPPGLGFLVASSAFGFVSLAKSKTARVGADHVAGLGSSAGHVGGH